ncbi:MAG: threonine--tRNA ligase [bacterium]|nr:threonine--tRNA ligase [bacterium]
MDYQPMADQISLETLRHSTSHIMAQAVTELFPGTKLAIGPAIADGFYYDFDSPTTFKESDLAKIEERMREIIKSNVPFERIEIDKETAKQQFLSQGERYKVELLNDIPDNTVTLYRHGSFVDLCRGPHLASTGEVKAFKLLSVAGAYWRGDEHNPMLQRIYGTAFYTQEELDAYVAKLEEAKRRDHRKLGKELDLFSIHEESGAGLVCYHPKGGRIRNIIETFWRKQHYKNGYELLYTPHIGRSLLWQTSGHLDFYQENMYSPLDIEGQNYFLKPMNCPFHILVYKSQTRSYRELPLRWAELGTVYRYERSGVLHGLLRVRGFTQDDAHIFCRPDQMESEIARTLNFVLFILRTFGFHEFDIYLATKPEKAVGSAEDWEKAMASLKNAIDQTGLPYQIDEGGGVFYGPKIDVKIKDSLGRPWQCSTIQFDFNLSTRFDLEYIGEDGKPHRPYMIHRALLGSLERFLGVLIEHYAGAFPTWLAPVQIKILPIKDSLMEYAKQVHEILKQQDLRVEVDERNEKLGHKIRDAQLEKIPYMLVLGEREQTSQTVAVRRRDGKDFGAMTIPEFLALLKPELNIE